MVDTKIDLSYPKTPCYMQTSCLRVIWSQSHWPVKIAQKQIFDLFAAVTLTLWPSYTNLTYIPWRYTGCANMNFLHQGFLKLSSDKQTYIRGAFKKFVTDTVNYEIRPSYFVTFQHRHLQLKCAWSAFLQSSDPVLEELLFLVFQPASSWGNFVSFHEFFQFRKKTEVTWSQDNASDHRSAKALAVIQNASFELLRHPPYSPFVFVFGRQMAGWKTRNNNSSTTVSQLWRNAGPSAF